MVTTVDYGFAGDQLHFVVFESAQHEVVTHAKLWVVTSSKGYNLCSGYIELPDGRRPDLPTSNRIYEFTSGKFVDAPIDFTRPQLKTYLDTRPKPPTIDGLKRFLSKQP